MRDLVDNPPDGMLQDPERLSPTHLRGDIMGAQVDVTVEARKPEQFSVLGVSISPAQDWQTTFRLTHPKFRTSLAFKQPYGKLWFLDTTRRQQFRSGKADLAAFRKWVSGNKLSGHMWFSDFKDRYIENAIAISERED
ncbi:hypothetical protein [Methylobacterium sp. NFXW15]|uniref:hypothetical protein n=1 Tax=Methylobacterium sp. NFXW15 TaxID=2819512 RepID=UPI003CF1774F